MEHKVTIFELVEQAVRRQQKEQPQMGQRKLKPARKASARTSRRPAAGKKARQRAKRKASR
jgi:hypothetical protein